MRASVHEPVFSIDELQMGLLVCDELQTGLLVFVEAVFPIDESEMAHHR